MNKAILILIMGCLCNVMSAQTVTLSILKGGKWAWTYPDLSKSRNITFLFTDTHMKEDVYFVRTKKRYKLSHHFYLADKPVSQFDDKMVGKAQSGKYLVHEFMNNRATSFQILSATPTKIKMKHPDGDILIFIRR